MAPLWLKWRQKTSSGPHRYSAVESLLRWPGQWARYWSALDPGRPVGPASACRLSSVPAVRIVRDLSLEPDPIRLDDDLVVHADNGDVLPRLTDASFDVIYIDPPFNTHKRQTRHEISVISDPEGTRSGFGGRRYRSRQVGVRSYLDGFEDYCEFIAPRFEQARRLLADHGTLYFDIDYREAHYCKMLLDDIFGRECFLNEIIWAY
jgi:site-specific DNA-methyltransferase (adenine-specific)